jgi:hypothetical protein
MASEGVLDTLVAKAKGYEQLRPMAEKLETQIAERRAALASSKADAVKKVKEIGQKIIDQLNALVAKCREIEQLKPLADKLEGVVCNLATSWGVDSKAAAHHDHSNPAKVH